MSRPRRLLLTGGAVAVLAVGLLAVFSLRPASSPAPDPGVAAPAAQTRPADALSRGIEAAQASLQRSPQDYATWANLALSYVQQAKITADPSYYPKAQGAADRSLAINSAANFLGWGAQAALKNALHDFVGARAAAQRGIAINGYNSTLYAALGDADTQLGRYDDAAAAIDRMNELLPGVAAFTRASYVFELRGDVASARSALERALADARTPSDIAFSQYYLGELAARYGGDYAGALAHIEAGLEASPDEFTLLAGRARVHQALGQTAAALADYRRVVAAVPQPQFVLELAELEQSLHDPDADRQYGLFRAEEKLFTSAGVALDVEPTLFEADHGDPAKALEYAAAGWKVRPFVEMADAYAWAMYVNHRYPEARTWSVKAFASGWDNNALFLYHRGMISKALGDRTAAKADLTRALQLDPHFNVLQVPVARSALAGL